MCFNTVVVNPRRKDIRVQVLNLLTFARYNRDGFSIYLVDGNEEKIYRTLDFEKFVEFIKENVKRPQLLHMHFRAASSGSISLRNVHMWRVSSNSDENNYYYVSHNGFVYKFARIYYTPPNIYYWGSVIPAVAKTKSAKKIKEELEEIIEEENDSDTLQFIKTEDFRNALFNDLNSFNEVLEKYSFWGVLFATNKKHIVAISYGKPLHVVLSNSVLYLSNENIIPIVARKKKIYGFEFEDALHTAYEDVVILFDVERLNVEKIVKLKRKIYYYTKTCSNSKSCVSKNEELDEETLRKLDETYWWYY
jgi:predicted glutamine amidotransferase